jgi:hypothetical protein
MVKAGEFIFIFVSTINLNSKNNNKRNSKILRWMALLFFIDIFIRKKKRQNNVVGNRTEEKYN